MRLSVRSGSLAQFHRHNQTPLLRGPCAGTGTEPCSAFERLPVATRLQGNTRRTRSAWSHTRRSIAMVPPSVGLSPGGTQRGANRSDFKRTQNENTKFIAARRCSAGSHPAPRPKEGVHPQNRKRKGDSKGGPRPKKFFTGKWKAAFESAQ
jgi:hypothetical protein